MSLNNTKLNYCRGEIIKVVRIYTSLSSSSCRKAKKWLDEHGVVYKEFNLYFYKINDFDIDFMLKNTEDGFANIISKRSNIYKTKKINFETLNVSEMKKIIIEHPNILRTPIIVDENKIQIGYNSDDIRIFIPKDLKLYFMKHAVCRDAKEYATLLQCYFEKNKSLR